jgi:hypothetical protein
MRSEDLTLEQVEAIEAEINRSNQYLNRLLKRMQYRNFPNYDPVWRATVEAQRAMLKLLQELRHCRGTMPMKAKCNPPELRLVRPPHDHRPRHGDSRHRD